MAPGAQPSVWADRPYEAYKQSLKCHLYALETYLQTRVVTPLRGRFPIIGLGLPLARRQDFWCRPSFSVYIILGIDTSRICQLTNMPSLSPERGRTRSRQQTSAFAKSQTLSRTRSAPRRTISPRSGSRSRTPSRTPSAKGDRRNGLTNGRDRSRSPTRSASRSRSAGRAGRRYRDHRDRSYTRSPSRSSLLPKSSKVP